MFGEELTRTCCGSTLSGEGSTSLATSMTTSSEGGAAFAAATMTCPSGDLQWSTLLVTNLTILALGSFDMVIVALVVGSVHE